MSNLFVQNFTHTAKHVFSLHVQIISKCVDIFNQCNAFIPLFLNYDLGIVGDICSRYILRSCWENTICNNTKLGLYIACFSYWSELERWSIFSLKYVHISSTSVLPLVSQVWISRCYSFNRWSNISYLTHKDRDNIGASSQTIFSNAFSWMKTLECQPKFHWIFHWGMLFKVQLTICNHWCRYGLALNRRQTIMWTNDGPIYWRIYPSPGLNESIYVVNQVNPVSQIIRKINDKLGVMEE